MENYMNIRKIRIKIKRTKTGAKKASKELTHFKNCAM